jgi:hypothetical protein
VGIPDPNCSINNSYNLLFTSGKELKSLNCEEHLTFTFFKEEISSYFTLESKANPEYFIYTSNKPMTCQSNNRGRRGDNTQLEFANSNMDLNEVKRLNTQNNNGQTIYDNRNLTC